MHVLGKERNERGLGHKGESLRDHGAQHGWLIVEKEKGAFARAGSLHDGRKHELRDFRKLTLGGQLRAEFGERFNGAQQSPKICGPHGHRRSACENPEQIERNTRRQGHAMRRVG